MAPGAGWVQVCGDGEPTLHAGALQHQFANIYGTPLQDPRPHWLPYGR